jgi:hypothetical protein
LAEQSLFDMSNLSSANRILLVSSLLLLIDSFLPWQHHCVAGVCSGTNAWAGPAGFLGVLMALSALGLLVFIVSSVLGAASALGAREVQVATWLAGGAVVFGVLRFLFALFNHAALFAWVGLVLLIVVAYGAYMRTQEPAPPQSAPRTRPRPPAPGDLDS